MTEHEIIFKDLSNWVLSTPVKDRKIKDIRKKIKKESRSSLQDLASVKKLLCFEEEVLEPKYR